MIRTMTWSARWRRDLGDLGREVGRRTRAAIERRVQFAIERLAGGEGDVKRVTGTDPPLFRLRVGIWRVLFRHDDEEIVFLRIRPSVKACR
jgi:mRNA-degrading endonuclease RelE of RelBE toxin-antitoxin system